LSVLANAGSPASSRGENQSLEGREILCWRSAPQSGNINDEAAWICGRASDAAGQILGNRNTHMLQSRWSYLAGGVLLGLVIGLNVAGLWPQMPVHAVATHGQDNFAMATGPVDEDVEAVYFLDFLTGDLRAAVLSLQTGKFNSVFTYKVDKDLLTPGAKNPRYLMVTGIANVRRNVQNVTRGRSIVYVAEVTSGKVAAYAIPWAPARQSAGAAQQGSFIPLDMIPVRTQAIRGVE
jgi:hypothetical protein